MNIATFLAVASIVLAMAAVILAIIVQINTRRMMRLKRKKERLERFYK